MLLRKGKQSPRHHKAQVGPRCGSPLYMKARGYGSDEQQQEMLGQAHTQE